MKYRDSPGIEPGQLGVIFLSQALDELLYEYSLSSYKPRVIGLEGLCHEALTMVEQIDKGLVARARIDPVLEEIENVVQSDPVASKLLEFPINYYLAFAENQSPADLRTRLQLLRNKLDQRQYLEALQAKLIELTESDKKKGLIYQCARRWLSALRSSGYSNEFIKTQVDEVFFGPGLSIASAADLEILYRKFTFKAHDYDVIFLTGAMITEIQGVASRFKGSIVSPIDRLVAIVNGLGLKEATGEALIRFKAVRAPDPYSAHAAAEIFVEHISDLLVLFHHKKKIHWSPNAVVGKDAKDWVFVKAKNPGVKRARDNAPVKAAAKLDSVFSRLAFADQDSISRFISVVRLHGSALEANSSAAQLVNLWTAMEVLVHKESTSKIKAVLSFLTPFLMYGYIDRLLYVLAGDIYRWRKSAFYKIIKIDELKGWRTHHRLAAVLLGRGYEAKRNELYDLVNGFLLLQNRCFNVSQMISDGGKLDAALAEHEQRVKWQITRIYRSRNLIVHDGSSPPYLDALTENAHEYLDSFIDRFFALSARTSRARSLEEAVVFQSRLYEHWRNTVRHAGPISAEDVRSLCALE